MTVYDALEKRHVMPRAWDDWADYRKAWSDWIVCRCKWDTTILIVGAGACNDYNLEHFSKFFRQVILFDLDESFMKEAAARVPRARRDRITYATGDFLGIRAEAYRDFCLAIQSEINRHGKNTDAGELANLALPLVEKMYRDAAAERAGLALPRADYVAVSGVHSQINHMVPWIWQAYMQVLDQSGELIFQRAAQENDAIIREMDDKLVAAAGRALFISVEKSRMGVPGSVEGARQALDDMDRRAASGEISLKESCDFAWGYDPRQQMVYEMAGGMYVKDIVGTSQGV